MFLQPISALRILTAAITVLLAAVLFLPKGSGVAGFLIGAGAGLSIGVQTIVWSRSLRWDDDTDRGEMIRIDVNQQQR